MDTDTYTGIRDALGGQCSVCGGPVSPSIENHGILPGVVAIVDGEEKDRRCQRCWNIPVNLRAGDPYLPKFWIPAAEGVRPALAYSNVFDFYAHGYGAYLKFYWPEQGADFVRSFLDQPIEFALGYDDNANTIYVGVLIEGETRWWWSHVFHGYPSREYLAELEVLQASGEPVRLTFALISEKTMLVQSVRHLAFPPECGARLLDLLIRQAGQRIDKPDQGDYQRDPPFRGSWDALLDDAVVRCRLVDAPASPINGS